MLYFYLNVPVHRDEEVQVQNSPLLICNALKPRKLDDDEFKCAIAVFEPEDPSKHPMYCKNKVHNPTFHRIYGTVLHMVWGDKLENILY
jgi:hypothetical protein